jgi:hypothetical protein
MLGVETCSSTGSKSMQQQLELPFPVPAQCEYCLKATYQPHFVVKHFGHHTQQMAFCDELCEQSHYLTKLRESGV